MTLDTGTKVAREKFHLLPMLDVVVSHLNSLAAKGKKMISKEPAFLYHGLVIPDDTPTSDLDDTHFLLYQLRHHILQPITPPILLMIMILQIMGLKRRKQKSHRERRATRTVLTTLTTFLQPVNQRSYQNTWRYSYKSTIHKIFKPPREIHLSPSCEEDTHRS